MPQTEPERYYFYHHFNACQDDLAQDGSEKELRSLLSKHHGKSESSKVTQLTKAVERHHEQNFELAMETKLNLLDQLEEAEKQVKDKEEQIEQFEEEHQRYVEKMRRSERERLELEEDKVKNLESEVQVLERELG